MIGEVTFNSLQRKPTEVVALTRQFIEQLQTTTHQHTLAFHAACAVLWVSADALLLEQILSNYKALREIK